MPETDLRYVVRSMAALSGIPVRLYEGGVCTCSEFPTRLPRDPLAPYEEAVLGIRTHVGYYVTPLFHYYGVINTEKGIFGSLTIDCRWTHLQFIPVKYFNFLHLLHLCKFY